MSGELPAESARVLAAATEFILALGAYRENRKGRYVAFSADGMTVVAGWQGAAVELTEWVDDWWGSVQDAQSTVDKARGTPVAGSPPLPDSDSPCEPRAGQDEARQARQNEAGGTASPLPGEGSGGEQL